MGKYDKTKKIEPEAKRSPELEQVTGEEVDVAEKPVEEVKNYALAINRWLGDVECAVADPVFKAGNPQSYRILGATLVMLKSARDHLGDK